jgi:hypothetical protein
LSLRTTKSILGRVILELVASEVPMRLVAPVNHRDVRLDVSLVQPCRKLSTAIGLICSDALGTNTSALSPALTYGERLTSLVEIVPGSLPRPK